MKKIINIVLLATVALFCCGCKDASLQYVAGEQVKENIPDGVTTDCDTTIRVHICGQVCFPGVYSVQQDSRICDVVQNAGGFTDLADTENVNQARMVSDGERIYIPSVHEREQSTESDGCININKADVETLCTLPGIGNSKAKQIIEYRNKHGDFQKIEDIMNVAGIKEGLFLQIAPYITVF